MNDRVRMDRRFDWVGPPDRTSKIRPIKLRRVDNETPLETNYREAREELNKWNSEFWANHNTIFEKKKLEFVEKRKNEISKIEHVTANDMSVFYKKFLDERHNALMEYNKQWYTRNLALIWPALKVNLVRFRRILLRK
ncbi:unnamed protein product [Auanema sp. JU1783]|nr:unnamed protein product [Auanema sp. JU1783]